MPFQPQALNPQTLKRLAKRLYRSWGDDFQQHPETGPTLARSQEILARALNFANWHEAKLAVQAHEELVQGKGLVQNNKVGPSPLAHEIGVARPEALVGSGSVLPILNRMTDEEVVPLTTAVLNLFSSQRFQIPEHREQLLSNLMLAHPGWEGLDRCERRVLWPVLFHFLMWKCRALGQNGLAMGVIRMDLALSIGVPDSDLAWNTDNLCWRNVVHSGLPALIGVLRAVSHLTNIEPTDDALTWQRRWISITSHSCGTKHVGLAVLALWLQMDQEAQSTDTIGALLSKIMAETNSQAATVFSVLWEGKRYEEAMTGADGMAQPW